MLIGGRTSRLPGHKGVGCIRGSVIFSTNTNFTSFEFESFHRDNWLVVAKRHSDVALNSSISALPITVSQKSRDFQNEYKL